MLIIMLALAACQPDPNARARLLTRLEAVLPAREDDASVRTGFDGFEAQMALANPGRESEIAAVLDDYAYCINVGLREAAPRLAIAAAEANLSDAEIEQLIAFYAGPDRERFLALDARQSAGDALTEDDTEFLMRYRNSEAARKFSAAVAEAARAFPASEDGRRMIGACTLRMRSAFGQAELALP
jgi:hypothetical protein